MIRFHMARSCDHRRRPRPAQRRQGDFESLGLTEVSLMAVAKGPDRDAGRETLFMPDREAIKLEPRDPVLISSSGCATRRIDS